MPEPNQTSPETFKLSSSTMLGIDLKRPRKHPTCHYVKKENHLICIWTLQLNVRTAYCEDWAWPSWTQDPAQLRDSMDLFSLNCVWRSHQPRCIDQTTRPKKNQLDRQGQADSISCIILFSILYKPALAANLMLPWPAGTGTLERWYRWRGQKTGPIKCCLLSVVVR